MPPITLFNGLVVKMVENVNYYTRNHQKLIY